MLKKETNWRVSVVLTAAQVQLVLDPNICLQEAVFFFPSPHDGIHCSDSMAGSTTQVGGATGHQHER